MSEPTITTLHISGDVTLVDRRCRTCRWWQDDKERDDVYGNVKRCQHPKVFHAVPNMDDLERLVVNDDPEHVLSGDEVGVMDGSGYYAAMFTGPDFGCVHHEPGAP